MNLNVRNFFKLGGYRAFPDVVTVQMDIREIYWVNVARGSFRCAFILQLRWYDQAFDTHEYANLAPGTEVTAHTIPYVTFDHVDEGDNPNGVPNDAAGLDSSVKHTGKVSLRKAGDPPGVLYFSFRVQATFASEFDLHRFPFDSQQLKINIRLWGSNVHDNVDHGRVLLPISVSVNLAHHLLEWMTFQALAYPTKCRMDRQDLEVCINVKRKSTFFVRNVFSMLFSMTTLSFCAFGVPLSYGRLGDLDEQYATPEEAGGGFIDGFEARCQITLSLMLSLVAYKFYLDNQTPQAPYFTFVDHYIYASFFTVAAVLVCNTVVLYPEMSLDLHITQVVGWDFGVGTYEHQRKGTNETVEFSVPDWIDHRKYVALVDSWLFAITFLVWIGVNIGFILWYRAIHKSQEALFTEQVYVRDKSKVWFDPQSCVGTLTDALTSPWARWFTPSVTSGRGGDGWGCLFPSQLSHAHPLIFIDPV